MKTTTLYDFTLTAGGSQRIEADANFYKILTATGDVSITRNGGSTVKPMRAGRGERNVDFLTLTIKDLSGAPNSGTILVGDSDFIDDTIVLSSSLTVRPEAESGNWTQQGFAMAANTPITVFAPGVNTAGVLLLSAGLSIYDGTQQVAAGFVAKSSAPANITDGSMMLQGKWGGGSVVQGELPKEQFIPAGRGLYLISTGGIAANLYTLANARWKAL